MDYNKIDNDITDRKANEIKEFIDSGQLVYIDSSIYNNNLNNSKLKTHFVSGDFSMTADNLVKNVEENSKLTLETIVSKYVKNNKIKPRIDITKSPKGDTGGSLKGDIANRNLNFKFNIGGIEVDSEKVNINLYLDTNGDGLFKEDEIVNNAQKVKIPQESIELNYSIGKEFFGYLDWKLEVVRVNNIKSYTTGSFVLKKLDIGVRSMKVLQIDASKATAYSAAGQNGSLDLKNNTEFKKIIEEVKKKGYEINITRESIEDFNARPFNKSDTESILNGQYDMIIVGFKDSFPAGRFSENALEEIEKFGKTGQGIMFTHDTFWYQGGIINSKDDESYRIIKRFADYIGQSRYKNGHNKEKDLQGNTIPHDPDGPSSGEKEKEGATIWSRYDVNNSESKKVYKTNEALITSYPYELGNTIGNTIDIRRAHAQYLQLNLEDENVVPWLNLTNNNGKTGRISNVNQYDVRNSYYTYSRGNITFSGTGENSRDDKEYPNEEMKLFMNTIIKAERGANHAPTISSNIIKATGDFDSEISTEQQTIDFKPTVEDIDNDKVNVVISTKSENGEWVKVSTHNKINQGTAINVPIINPYYQKTTQQIGTKIMQIKVEATDIKGANAKTVIYKIKPISEPTIGFEITGGKGLVGDNIDVGINLTKLNLNDKEITDVTIQTSADRNTISGLNENEVKIGFLKDETSAIKDYSVVTKIEGVHPITVNIKYKLGGVQKELSPFIIPVKSKKGLVIVKVKDTNGSIINNDIKVSLKGNSVDKESNQINNGVVKFNTIPTGNYNITSNKYSSGI